MKKNFTVVVSAILILAGTQKINAQAWKLAGNNDATSSSKLGTKNAVNLRLVTDNKERLTIDATGRVGVGIIAPEATFQVQKISGTPYNEIIRTSANLNGGYNSIYENNIYRGYWGSYAGKPEDMDFGTGTTNSTGNIHFTITAVPKVTIDNIGRMGIGTTIPTRKLQVQDGDIRISASSSSPSYLEFLRTGSASNQVDYRFENESSLSRLYLSSSNNDFAGFADIAWFHPFGSPHVFVVNGSALANGGIWQDSDQKLKRNINDVNSAMEIVKQLKPKTYQFKTDEYAKLNLPATKQYGFVAQELEKVLPELVQTSPQPVRVNTNGKREMEDIKSVNYTELIPILTKAIQEQQAQIEELKQTVSKLSGETVTGITERSQKIGFAAGALLDQNIPNPFNNSTTINFTLPQKYSTAKIVIADRAGKVIKDVKVSGNGKNSLTLNSSSLTSGTYSYSLYVDSKLISTRQMVLTR